MPYSQSLILFAHGARDPRWAHALHALADALRDEHGESASVHTAFLERLSPTLMEALEEAASGGALRIHVMPVFWAGAGHIENDLPPILTPFRERYPHVTVRVLPVLSELPGMLEFVARTVGQSLQDDADLD